MDLFFGVAGPGRVGMSLAKAFAAAGLSCAGVYGGTHAKARAAELGVRHFNEPLGIVAAADVIFICVPDRFINEAAESMAKAAAQAGLDVCGKYFYHVSGSAGLDELAPLKALGAETGSLHPLQSFASPVKSLAGIGMAVDGSAKAQELGFKLARLLGAAAFKVPQKERALYHAAACFCSNFTVTVTTLAEKLLLRWTEGYGGKSCFGRKCGRGVNRPDIARGRGYGCRAFKSFAAGVCACLLRAGAGNS